MDKEFLTRDEYQKFLLELLEARDFVRLRRELSDDNAADLADFIEELPEDESAVVFRLLPKELGAEVFAHLEFDAQQNLAAAFSDREVAEVLEKLFVDDAVDFLEEMPASVVKRVLALTDSEKRSTLNHFLQYPEDSAGSIMTSEFTNLKKTMTVREAIDYLRRRGEDRETIYTCYVIDAERILEGVISVKTLLLASDEEIVGDLMETDVIKVHTLDDQEDVAAAIHMYNFLALPVVDNENRLVGMKSRGVYETPGGTVYYKAHRWLEQLCLEKDTMHFKDHVSLRYAELVYNGQWFHPLREALAAFVDETQKTVNGTVKVKLYKGNVFPAGVSSPTSLYDEEIASFGEDNVYDQKDAEGFINLFGLPTKVYAGMKQKNAAADSGSAE